MKKPTELNDKVDSFKLLNELGYTAYSVGPIYAYAGVSEDIEERFLREAFESRPVDPTLTALAAAGAVRPLDKPSATYGTIWQAPRQVIARCESWCTLLAIMDTLSFEWFKQWLLSNTFVSREKRTYAVPRLYEAPVMDPFYWAVHGKEIPTMLHVFSVSSIRWSLKPVTSVLDKALTPSFVDLQVKPPDEDVRKEGAKILKVVKDL